MNANQEPKCPVCGKVPEQKLREYTPASTNRLTGIYFCCSTVFPYPPVNPPAEDDGGDLEPASRTAPVTAPDRKAGTRRQLDLTEKRDVFLTLIRQGLAKCDHNKMLPITRLDVTFDLTSEAVPHVWVTLDSHPTGEPNSGTSQTYQLVNKTIREWKQPCHAAFDGEKVTVISKAGAIEVNDEETLCKAVGLFFVEIITALRDSGALRALPRGTACYLGVSTYDGVFGWPVYDDRGPANMF